MAERGLRRRDAVPLIDKNILEAAGSSAQASSSAATFGRPTYGLAQPKRLAVPSTSDGLPIDKESKTSTMFSALTSHPSTSQGPTTSAPATSLPVVPSTSASASATAPSRPFARATFGAPSGGSLFSNTKPATGGGLFGSSNTAAATNVAPQPNPQQELLQNAHPLVYACGDPKIMGTDDDRHIAHLNQVAAALAIGNAPYKQANEVKTCNMEKSVFQKFVGIGYNKISERTDDEGFVTIVLKHPIDSLNTDERKAKILEAITNILGNQQNLKVLYAPGSKLRALPDGATEITIIVKEGGFVVPALKLAQVLNDPNRLTQLEGQLKADKTRILAKVGMSKSQKEKYLAEVPPGIDERIWRQAIAENPAPTKMMPVPVVGFEELRNRQLAQMAESKIYQDALDNLANRVEKVESDHARAQVEMEAIRCRHKQLSYRLLRILLAQWINQRFSKQIDTDEDVINARCDTLLAKLNRHNQLQFWISNFHEILEKNGDKLKEGALKAYDMTEENQVYARKFLTEILYIGENLVATSHLQMEDLEAIRRTLEGE